MDNNINQKIARIPFWILYLISAFIISFDLVYTHLFLSNNPQATEGNPINLYFLNIFGPTYFIFLIPTVLVLLYGAAKFAGWVVKTYYRKSQIKGDNHTIIVVILLTLPNFLFNEVFAALLGIKPMLNFRNTLIFGLFLMTIYLIITEIVDSKTKNIDD